MSESGLRSFRVGHAAGGAWQPVVQRCLDALRPVASDETLGFVYVTDALANDFDRIVALLRTETAIDDWVGTVGLGVCAGGRDYFDEPAAAVMLAALPAGTFQIIPARSDESEAIPAPFARWVEAHRPVLGLVHADPRNRDVPDIVADLAERTGAFLVGGLSSSRAAMAQVAGEVRQKVVSGVLFAEDVRIATGLTQGCAAVGPVHRVTQSQNNLIAALDGRPALAVLLDDLGAPATSDLRRMLAGIHAALPVPGTDSADYLVRNLLGVDPAAGMLALGAEIDPGDRLMFCRRDPESAERDLRRMLAELRGRIDGRPKGGIYVSCVARGPNMFGPGSRELGILAEEFGDVPLVGFFANGEISNGRLYGYTGVLTLFA